MNTSAHDSVLTHDFTKSEREIDENNARVILAIVERNENPFKRMVTQKQLYNILNLEVMTQEISQQLSSGN